ncbi:hypothetical protein KC349_g2 [Hortaea werneckii]|nr:hypothetical protein KC349_g2 [Hortaea werneckii]
MIFERDPIWDVQRDERAAGPSRRGDLWNPTRYPIIVLPDSAADNIMHMGITFEWLRWKYWVSTSRHLEISVSLRVCGSDFRHRNLLTVVRRFFRCRKSDCRLKGFLIMAQYYCRPHLIESGSLTVDLPPQSLIGEHLTCHLVDQGRRVVELLGSRSCDDDRCAKLPCLRSIDSRVA